MLGPVLPATKTRATAMPPHQALPRLLSGQLVLLLLLLLSQLDLPLLLPLISEASQHLPPPLPRVNHPPVRPPSVPHTQTTTTKTKRKRKTRS
jgi:hypothetical protein